MKMFKRIAAALLVGVMALAMLTACGGGHGGSNSNATETLILNTFNKASGTNYSNNGDLQAKTRAVLNKIDANGQIKAADMPHYTEGNQTIVGVDSINYNQQTGDISMVVYEVDSGYDSETQMYNAIVLTQEDLDKWENTDPDPDEIGSWDDMASQRLRAGFTPS